MLGEQTEIPKRLAHVGRDLLSCPSTPRSQQQLLSTVPSSRIGVVSCIGMVEDVYERGVSSKAGSE